MQEQASGDAPEVTGPYLVTIDFVDCYRDHYARLIRALCLAGADRPTAEEVAQEAFARSFARWRRVSRGTNPPGYVYTTGFRLLQRAQRRSSREEPADAGAFSGSIPAEDVTTALAIRSALAAMPARRRACAVMCLVVGLTTHEAAEALGVADGTVRKHLDEAREDLRTAVNP